MTNLIRLIGSYLYQNKVLTNSTGTRLLITNRSNVTNTKTPLFLLDKTTAKGGYISSLYPLHIADAYNFDYKGFKYILTIDEANSKAEISTK